MYGFAAPKFIARDFFESHAVVCGHFVGVVNAADAWASWPWLNDRWQYRALTPHVWLKNDQGTFQMPGDGNQWPGGWNFGDHDMDEYQVRGEAIAAAPLKPVA
jgi:hypothetical protein